MKTRCLFTNLLFLLLFFPTPGMLSTELKPALQITAGLREVHQLSLLSNQVSEPVALSYPPDPSADIPWSAGFSSVTDIQSAFNHARTMENSQLGSSIPGMTLPEQTTWNSMSDGEKALWLINRERIDRGVAPLHGLENNVNNVAQYYADYLLNNNAWGHQADGSDPWERLSNNPTIGACQDFLSVAENLAVFATSGSSIPMPVERSIYMWMYDDGDCCGWGHRHAVLWNPYNDNSGAAGREGFLGIGRANGGPYQGGFSQPWPHAEIIVMNVFDPCPGWVYSNPPGPAQLISPSGSITNPSPTFSWQISPDSDTTDPASWYYLWIDGPSGHISNQWYEASATCNGSTCSVTPNVTLASGAYTWWIQSWNETGTGPWSPAGNFNIPSPLLPGPATLISPQGNIGANTPTYSWSEVSGSTWYYLWVEGPSGPVVRQWYRSADVNCNGSTCSASPSTVLTPGAYKWWIQTYNASGYGPWSTRTDFTITPPPLPDKATLISPAGSFSVSSPAYTWNQVGGSTWYYLWVEGASGPVIQQWYTSAQAGCNVSTCSVTPATVLSPGAYKWWIQTYNSAGYGPWSTRMDFTIPVPSLPEKATLVSPNGSINIVNPTYSWNAVSGSNWYYLYISGSSGYLLTGWYRSSEVCSGGICSIAGATPNLASGGYSWWIQTYNSAGYGPWSTRMDFTISGGSGFSSRFNGPASN